MSPNRNQEGKSALASGYFLSTALVQYKVLPCSKRCDLVTPPFPLPVQLYIETYVFKEEQELRYFSHHEGQILLPWQQKGIVSLKTMSKWQNEII